MSLKQRSFLPTANDCSEDSDPPAQWGYTILSLLGAVAWTIVMWTLWGLLPS